MSMFWHVIDAKVQADEEKELFGYWTLASGTVIEGYLDKGSLSNPEKVRINVMRVFLSGVESPQLKEAFRKSGETFPRWKVQAFADDLVYPSISLLVYPT